MRKPILALVIVLTAGAAPAAEPPLAGCYQRAYDAAHLAQHKGQIVMRASLSVTATGPEIKDQWGASGTLRLWVRGQEKSFDSHGACNAKAGAEALFCNGSLSAAESEGCKTKQDGVRQCRIDQGSPGAFKIEARPYGVRVSIEERLELVQAPYDGGPYLYLSPRNAENHDFLLKKTACK
jgi:hypothetical protein